MRSDSDERGPFTLYVMSCKRGFTTWTADRRFSEFVRLAEDLATRRGSASGGVETLPPFPSHVKSPGYFRSSRNAEFVAERSTALFTYVQRLLLACAEEQLLRDFLSTGTGVARGPARRGVPMPRPPAALVWEVLWQEEETPLEERSVRGSMASEPFDDESLRASMGGAEHVGGAGAGHGADADADADAEAEADAEAQPVVPVGTRLWYAGGGEGIA